MEIKVAIGILIIAAIVIVGTIVYIRPQTKAASNELPTVPNESDINLPNNIETNTNNVSLPEPNTTDITLPDSI